ncbi:hypothetical protein [Streptomyces mirabilis]|nr:hypothetical protein [Streptomyces mirabilis]MCX4432124.1 hypothetical protein [Streptomyces mirabilis]
MATYRAGAVMADGLHVTERAPACEPGAAASAVPVTVQPRAAAGR